MACLNSKEIRENIGRGILVFSFDEAKIQPSSFEPRIRDELFILDTETTGLFRPQAQETVYHTLLQLPKRQRNRVGISKGFEIKKGFTYIVPLEEKLIMYDKEHVKSSPKSSFGRVFLNTRMLTDYNPCFDEVNSQHKVKAILDSWLLLQPLAFNLIIYPGLSLNQLRFFCGYDSQLTPSEVIKELEKNPILYEKTAENLLVPTKPFITNGLEIHLDLLGKDTGGIVGLRARHNPVPIDLSTKEKYEAEEFFEPLKGGNKKLIVTKGEHYLLASKEIIKVPSNLNIELKNHSDIGLSGPLHFAGFIDNGFPGDLVFEIRPDELSSMVLEDGMPISKLEIFRTGEPDKLYGEEIGSGYTSDPLTIKYLEKFAEKHKDSGIFRKTWITWKKAIEKLGQRTLS